VGTTAMDGGWDFACVRCAVSRSPHAHKEHSRHNGDCWKGLLKVELYSTFH
jgi:hypothetical protein